MQVLLAIAFFLLTVHTAAAEDVVRKTYLVRGQDYWVNVFYEGNTEVARYKESLEGTFDRTGKVPDGRVVFYDGFKNAIGEENYKNGSRDGPYQAYYPNGQLKIEATYTDGKLLRSREYYSDGKLRAEVNYEDALEIEGRKEVGEGRLFYPDGRIKYEWSFTKKDSRHFRRAYTREGEVRFEAYYDDAGNLVEEKGAGAALSSPAAGS